MDKIYKYFCILAIFAVQSLLADAFERTQLVRFDIAKVQIHNKEHQGQRFTSVTYDGFINSCDVGEASLPYQIIEFEVPSDKYSFAISYSKKDSKVLPHDYKVEIAQKPVLSGTDDNEAVDVIDDYATRLFPVNMAEIVQDGYFMGDRHLLHVFVSPFRYDADRDELTFVESVEVTIRDLSGTQLKSAASGTYTSLLRPLDMSKSALSTPRSSVIGLHRPTPLVGDSLPVYEYAVITSRELAPAFDAIIGLKKQKGLDAGVVCIEDILEDSAFAQGDTISCINDNAALVSTKKS